MSDIIEEMGGYMGDGSEFEVPPQNARQKITCPKCDHKFTWSDAKISEQQHAILVLVEHGFSIRAIGRMMSLHPESVRYRIKEAKRQIQALIKQEIAKELESFCGHSNEIPEHVIKYRIKELGESNGR